MKPQVTTKCPANVHTAPNERIVEFSSDAGGGLIGFTVAGGKLHVHVYRHDPTVLVTVGKNQD